MGFLKPKIPTAPPPANPAMPAISPTSMDDFNAGAGMGSHGSLVSSGVRGLVRRASTQRTSLIGGNR